MVVNGSKSGEKLLLAFFFELWSNNKKTAEKAQDTVYFPPFLSF